MLVKGKSSGVLGHTGVTVIVCWECPRGSVTCSSSEGEAVRSLTAMASRSPAQVSERRPLLPQEDFPNLWEKELKALFGLTGAKRGNMSSRGKVGTVGEALPGCFIPCGPQRGALEVLGALRSPLGHPDAGEPSCRPGVLWRIYLDLSEPGQFGGVWEAWYERDVYPSCQILFPVQNRKPFCGKKLTGTAEASFHGLFKQYKMLSILSFFHVIQKSMSDYVN